MENRGRAQLICRLDDPVEKAAFDILQSRAYRGKAAYVARCIVARENEEKMAERIAQKIVETLNRQAPSVIQPPKRKRGRPPKRRDAPTISGLSAPLDVDIPDLPKTKKKPVEKRTPREIPSPSPIETRTPTPAQKNTFIQRQEASDGIPDDAMLQSMESFISGLSGNF